MFDQTHSQVLNKDASTGGEGDAETQRNAGGA